MKTWFLIQAAFPTTNEAGGTSESVFSEVFQLVSPWKPIGKRPLEMSLVLVSWVGALAAVVENLS